MTKEQDNPERVSHVKMRSYVSLPALVPVQRSSWLDRPAGDVVRMLTDPEAFVTRVVRATSAGKSAADVRRAAAITLSERTLINAP